MPMRNDYNIINNYASATLNLPQFPLYMQWNGQLSAIQGIILIMGGFLSEIEQRTIQIDDSLLNCSYSKLIEYYSSYKSICEGYTISIAEYTHIFGNNQLSFAVWDDKGRGKIDSIEMFAGLVIFSAMRYELKIKFLFQIFDFNEEGCLCYENLVLMLLNICNATFKVYALGKVVAHAQVELFIDQYFTEESRVELSRMVRWTYRVPVINQYFRVIGHEMEQLSEEKRIAVYEWEAYDSRRRTGSKGTYLDKDFCFDAKFMAGLQSVSAKDKVDQLEMMNLSVDWIFGINVSRQTIRFLRVEGRKAGNERIIYVVGRAVVMYYPKLNTQRYYVRHQQPVSVIDVGYHRTMVASAQGGSYPQIHIWDAKTRLTLLKFKRLHKFGVTFMSFMDLDRMLVTVSDNGGESPVIVVNLLTQEIVMSTFVKMESMGIWANSLNSVFSIVGGDSVASFTPVNDSFSVVAVGLKHGGNRIEPMLCFVRHPKGYLISCHKGRRLLVWDEKMSCFELDFQSLTDGEVIQMCFLGEDLLLLDQCDIELVQIRAEDWKVSRSQLLDVRSGGLFNLRLAFMCPMEEGTLLVASQFGDLVRIEGIDSLTAVQLKMVKYYQVFRLQQAYDCCLLNAETMLIFSGRFLYVIDRNEKQLRMLTNFDYQLKQADCYKESLVVAAPLESGKCTMLLVLSLGDFTARETFKAHCAVEDIKVTENYLLVLSQQTLDIYHKVADRFFQKEAVRHQLAPYKATSLSPTLDSRIYLLITESRELCKINLNGFNQIEIGKVEKQTEPLFDNLGAYYPDQNYKFPLLVSSNRRFVALGRKSGDIYIWESLNQATGCWNAFSAIKLHADRISRLLLEENGMVSVGGQDGMVVAYKHQSYIEREEDEAYFDQSDKQQKQKGKLVTRSTWQTKKTIRTVHPLLGSYLKESQIQVCNLVQAENKDIRQTIEDIVDPRNKQMYQTLNKPSLPNTYETLHLQTKAIFGMSTSQPKSVFYLHSYPETTKSTVDPSYWQPDQSSTLSGHDLHFAKRTLQPIDDTHSNCKREVLYFSDRLCLLKDVTSHQQRVYEHHRRKVTCLAVHPSRQLICSCECGQENPVIHVWSGEHLATRAVIATRHSSIITRVQFSRDGKWIVTLGGGEREQSIQMSSWRGEELVAFRSVQQQILSEIMFNPYVREEICVVGVGLIRIYKVKELQLVLEEECRVTDQRFQALAYTSSVFGNEVESDIITGSTNGDIGLYVCGKFIISRQKAHSGGVCCLRLAQLFGYKRVLISGGGQGVIKIWDVKFSEISKKDLREELYAVKMNESHMPECPITSIDVYQCMKTQGTEHPPTLLLVATADGSVMEARIHNEFQGYQAYSTGTGESAPMKQKINFDMTLLFTAPPDSPALFQLFRLCGQYMMVTYSSLSCFIQFWNIDSGERQRVVALPSAPAFLKFLNNGEAFLVGYRQRLGSLEFYQVSYGMKVVGDIVLISDIPLQKSDFVPQTAVFSRKDNRLAVAMRSPELDQILIYELQQAESSSKLQYLLQIRIEQSVSAWHRLIWMDFSSSSQALLVGWREMRRQNNREIETRTVYKCYSVVTEELVPAASFDFPRLNFACRIKANYVPCLQLAEPTQKEFVLKETLTITAMAQYENYLLLGTVNGEVLILQSDFFRRREEEKCRVWSYLISDSPISNLVAFEDRLLVSTEAGSSVTELCLKAEQSWMVTNAAKDPYSEQMTGEMIQNRIRNVYNKRKKMQGDEVEGQWKCGVQLRLSAVIGRTALFNRNNLFIDLKDNIISFSGCNLLIMKYREGQRLAQSILKPDVSPSSCHPEISCLALGECKRKLLVGTSELNAKIMLWDISTNTSLFEVRFAGFVSVRIAKLSPSNNHAALLMLARSAQQYLLFVDLRSRVVLALHCFPTPFPFNDICFVNGQELQFLACGSNYLAEWRYQNGQLGERRYSLGEGQDLQEVRAAGIVFYSIIYVGQFAISSGSDGYLYFWRQGRVVKRQNAHPREAVLSLYTSTNSKIFVSGATDGRVIIWHFGSSLIIQKIQQFSTYVGKEVRVPLKYHIQSICMTKQSLIVGNRGGEIIQFPFSSGQQMQELPANSRQPLTILSAFAHEAVNSCAFNPSSRKLYVMTETQMGYGTFAVFDLATLEKIKEDRVQLKSGLVKMLVCRQSPRIFLALKGGIICFTYQAEVRDEKYNKLVRRKDWLKCDSGIKAVCLSSTETYLAVLIAPNANENAKIQIYRMDVSEGLFYQLYRVEENIPASIELIDFSAHHDYLVFQGSDEEQTVLDLLTREKVKPGAIENQIEWNEDAKRTSPSMLEVTAAYSEENKLLRLVQVMDKCVVATDQMGSLRLFAYPLAHTSHVYVEHLNHVYLCVLSPDSRTLVTVGREDRAIHLWDIVHKT